MNDFAKSANLSWNRRLMLTLKLAVTANLRVGRKGGLLNGVTVTKLAVTANLRVGRKGGLLNGVTVTPLRSPPSPIGLVDSKAQTPLV